MEQFASWSNVIKFSANLQNQTKIPFSLGVVSIYLTIIVFALCLKCLGIFFTLNLMKCNVIRHCALYSCHRPWRGVEGSSRGSAEDRSSHSHGMQVRHAGGSRRSCCEGFTACQVPPTMTPTDSSLWHSRGALDGRRARKVTVNAPLSPPNRFRQQLHQAWCPPRARVSGRDVQKVSRRSDEISVSLEIAACRWPVCDGNGTRERLIA